MDWQFFWWAVFACLALATVITMVGAGVTESGWLVACGAVLALAACFVGAHAASYSKPDCSEYRDQAGC